VRALLQRVASASVAVDGAVVGAIGPGLLVLLGVGQGDTDELARALAQKVAGLRVFEDEAGKMNLSLADTSKAMLCVSQFTLYADTTKGRRPSFTAAMAPDEAKRLYGVFCGAGRSLGLTVAEGIFAADMQVSLVNDGPVTLWLDTAEW
jgi:D-aminoacyl-tRNA deacylase